MTTVLTAVFTAVVILLAGNVPWAGFGRISGLGARNLLVRHGCSVDPRHRR